MPPHDYWSWVRSEAALVDTDGCSAVLGFKVECCEEHDLAYFYARDPRIAYRRWLLGHLDYWAVAGPITRGEADRRFRRCHQIRSTLGRWSPMAIYRWLGVKWGAQDAWDRHRTREAEDAVGV
jgi:hypothetical protein